MSNVTEIKDRNKELELECDAVIAIEKIKAIGKMFNFNPEGQFWQGYYASFVQNMGEVLEEEIKKINVYMFPGSV